MKIFIVGDGHSGIHEVAVNEAFKKLGHETFFLFWFKYFESSNRFENLFKKIQNKLLFGPVIKNINHDFLEIIGCKLPDVIFLYRGTHIYAETIEIVKKKYPWILICGYNNDDPFSPMQSKFSWRHFMKSLKYLDIMFAYRKHNIPEYKNAGSANSVILKPWFIPSRDYPLPQKKKPYYIFDVVFIGHYEDDERFDYLKTIDRLGLKLGIFGPDWDYAPDEEWLHKYKPIKSLTHIEYRNVIHSSKLSLCFFSKINRDEYTRRNFEIPAMGGFLLSEYSYELSTIYEEDVDMAFFRNKYELIDKIQYYIENDDIRERVAKNGRKRVIQGNHDIYSRMRYVLDCISKIRTVDHVK
jgi:spore maturation protein CgeB